MTEPRRLKPLRLDTPAEPLAADRPSRLRTEPAPTEPGERARLPPTQPDEVGPPRPSIASMGDRTERPPAPRRALFPLWLVVWVGVCGLLGGLLFVVLRGRLPSSAAPAELVPSLARVAPPPTAEERYSLTALPIDPDETKGAWAYSNECYKRWEAREIDGAERHCLSGLERPDAVGKVRGALYYNLGLIAESRGEWAKAEEWLLGSLSLRAKDDPGRAFVEEVLKRVRGKLTPAPTKP